MKIAMANDHAGTALKNVIKAYLESQGYEVKDFGTYDGEFCDLSDYVYPAAMSVGKGECDRGIFVDGVGYGSAMIANKVNGIYACVCQDPFCAQLSREHNDANVLCLGGKLIGEMIAMEIVKTWMNTEPLTAEKYVRRRDKVKEINDELCKSLS
jgi:ribose 5-phosphate isomerase B